MTFITWKNANIVFNVLCLAATISLVYWCLHGYLQDDNLSEITFTKFNKDESSPYPELTLCLQNPFLEDKLKDLGTGINSSTYRQYLQGELWDDRMVDVDFDNVTINLENYLLHARVYTATPYYFEKMNFSILNTVFAKCFTFHHQYPKRIPELSVKINNSIFPNGIRPAMEFEFMVRISFPGQVLRTQAYLKKEWPVRVNYSDNYEMQFGIRDVEVIRRRSTASSKCQVNWKNYDLNVLESILNDVGCRPFYSPSMKNYPPCSTSQEMQEINWRITLAFIEADVVESITPPCSEIQRIPAKYSELEMKEETPLKTNTNYGSFLISVEFESGMFKEIKEVQAYDFQELLGNAGGHAGLIIGGYCLKDLPGLLVLMYNYFKKKLSKTNGVRQENTVIKKDDEETKNKVDSLEMRINNLEAVCSRLETNNEKQVPSMAIYNVGLEAK